MLMLVSVSETGQLPIQVMNRMLRVRRSRGRSDDCAGSVSVEFNVAVQ